MQPTALYEVHVYDIFTLEMFTLRNANRLNPSCDFISLFRHFVCTEMETGTVSELS